MDDARVQLLKSYRYLRLAMVVLAVVLAASVVVEVARSGRVLDSISAYYYTPARGALVGCLVAIGVGLVALQGRTVLEDAALNLAGMFAPVVAFVPYEQGRPAGFSRAAAEADIDNNLIALLAGAVAAVVLLVASRRVGLVGGSGPMRTGDRIGVVAGIAVVVAGVVWRVGWREGFVTWAHPVAAVAMFAMIAAVVWVNTRSGPHRHTYRVVLVLMLLTQLVWLSWPFWSHAILVVEASLITLFAVFWLVQTWDPAPAVEPRSGG